MMKNFETQIKNIKRNIPFSPPDISELEIAEVAEALRSGWITTGPRTKELERRLAEYCHTSKVVCLNSATAAEELNFRICGIGEGDEVIVPAYTYNIVFKFSEQNYCSMKEIVEFDELPYDRKIMFTTKDYHAKSQILWGGMHKRRYS